MQRFPIDLGPPPARILLLVFVTHQSNSYVDVGPDAVAVRMGPVFQRRFPRDQVGSPRRRGWPILLGFGWRTDFSGLVGLTGTRRGVVELAVPPFRSWISLRLVGTTHIAVRVHDPEGLIAALSADVRGAA